MAADGARAGEAALKVRRHRHEFTALWWRYGRFGPQDVHLHSCFEDGCDTVLIGAGRECGGNEQKHRRTTLQKGAGQARGRQTMNDTTRAMLLIKSIDANAHLRLSEYTAGWYVASSIWECDGVIESGITEHRPTPEGAVEAFVYRLTHVPVEKSLRTGHGYDNTIRHWRWNGVAFVEERHAHA